MQYVTDDELRQIKQVEAFLLSHPDLTFVFNRRTTGKFADGEYSLIAGICVPTVPLALTPPLHSQAAINGVNVMVKVHNYEARKRKSAAATTS